MSQLDNSPIQPLDDISLAAAAKHLAELDPDLAATYRRYGPPPLWARPPGFTTLIRIILEQQVSLASALAAFNRLGAALGEITPAGVLRLDDAALKAIGFSRQKTRYARLLAEALLNGSLDLDALASLPDGEVRARLVELKGIGRWSADIYLLMALRRPDVWPSGDLALVSALARLKRLPGLPAPAEFEQMGEAWRPWRAVAARTIWYDYLGGMP